MAERIIVSVVTLLVMLCLFVYCVDVLAIISKNMEFYDVCRGYMHIAEQQSGLEEYYRLLVIRDLSDRGFENITIEAPFIAMYGSAFSLKISASYIVNSIDGVFKRSMQKYVMSFEQNVIARRIQSYEP